MNTAMSTIGGSTLGKFALSVVSTATAYVLTPIAYQYATTDLNKGLVIAIIAVWALALTRMWGEVISLTAQAVAKIPGDVAALDLNLMGSDFDKGSVSGL